jgi:S1-C subfamily serine protease
VSPEVFGDVFRQARPSLLRVDTGDKTHPYATGFLIGAKGELVFGARHTPAAEFLVRAADGKDHAAKLLGFDEAVKLAVAQIVDAGHTEPLVPAHRARLSANRWVVVVMHDDKGEPAPFAGLVDGPPRIEHLPPTDAPRVVAAIDAPGSPGSPVLSIEGELVGIVIADGKRRTRAVAIESVVPFLRQVVLGG